MSKILFVEDGSVDVDEVQRMLPEVPIVIYRAGSIKPEFTDIDTPVNVIKKEPCEPKGVCTDKALPVYTPEEIREAIKETLFHIGVEDFNVAAMERVFNFSLDAKGMEYFISYVLQKLTEAKTCGADPSGDN